jgi:AbiV family abortive infection protein
MDPSVYTHPTEAVLDAFTKAYESASLNYDAASALAERRFNGPATSLAVLALEEIGKMVLLDGLLFARTDDDRYKAYTKGHLSHRMKLDAVEIYPMFLHYLSLADPRYEETRYKQTIAVVMTDLKAKRQRLVDLFGESFGFQDLDALKQKGFYSHQDGAVFKSNAEGLDPEKAKAILDLTWRVIEALRFVLKNALDEYKKRFASYRSKVDQQTLLRIRQNAEAVVENMFGREDER